MQQYSNMFLSSSRAPKGAGFGKCSVFAFTACSRGEGVSYVVESFGTEIAQMTGNRTLVADVDRLMNIDIDHYSRIGEFCMKTNVPNLWSLPEKNVIAGSGNGTGQDLVLDPKKSFQYDKIKNTYADMLQNWGLMQERCEILKFLSNPPPMRIIGKDFATVCSFCGESPVFGSKCPSCHLPGFECVVCHFAG